MKQLLFTLALLAAVAVSACKHQYWTIVPGNDADTVAVVDNEPGPVKPEPAQPQPAQPEPVKPEPNQPDPEPQPEPVAPKEIIFVLGIDGMD